MRGNDSRWARWGQWWTKQVNRPGVHAWIVVARIVVPILLAALVAWVPAYEGLDAGGRASLFLLVLAGGLWISEGIPAFAVSLLVIGYAILVLGKPGGVLEAGPSDWERYIGTWGSPLIWLFLGGFVLAAGAERTGLTQWLSIHVLQNVGQRPWWLLAACMGITFVFSMFISNTAAATMMVAITLPIVDRLAGGDPLRSALLLGIAFAANIGGMGTVIGSPPNAIAAGALKDVGGIDFARWMLAGLPPAVLLLVIVWGYLLLRYPAWVERVDFERLAKLPKEDREPLWRRIVVMVTFTATVLLWLTSTWHQIPAAVVSFVPICVLTATRVLSHHDIRALPWDVLLLIAGGLTLGIAVTDSGLAEWLVLQLKLDKMGIVTTAIVLSFIALLLSNLMSNTAAANILVPIGMMAGVGYEAVTVVPIALSASAAMALPISTPPNAIVYSTEEIRPGQLVEGGLLVGILAPILTTYWVSLVLG